MLNIEEAVYQAIVTDNVEQLDEILKNRNENNFHVDAVLENSTNMTAVHLAAELKNIEQVHLLLQQGANVNLKTHEGYTCLHLAILNDNLQVTEAILPAADTSETDRFQRSALHFAVENKRHKIVMLLLRRKVALNQQDFFGDTALHEAIRQKDIVLIKMLLCSGADPNINNARGLTAFHECFPWQNHDLTAFFLNCYIDVSSKNGMGDNALHLAILHNSKCEIIERLFKIGVNVNDVTSYGETPLHLLFKCYNHPITAPYTTAHTERDRNLLKILRLLLNNGADTKAVNKENNTALDYAIRYKQLYAVKYLIIFGASVERDQSRVPAPEAIKNRNVEAIKVSLRDIRRQIYPNQECSYLFMALLIGDSALRYAMLKLLLESGEDVNVRNTDGSTFLHWCIKFADTNLFYLCMSFGADVNAKSHRQSALFQAVQADNHEIAEYLINKKANVNEVIDNVAGLTPPVHTSILAVAVYKRSIRMTTLLLKHGAHVDDLHAWRALAGYGTGLTMQLFEAYGATRNDPSLIPGKVFFREAIKNDNFEIVKYMLEKGADVNCNYGNCVPLELKMRHQGLFARGTARASSKSVETENCLVRAIAILSSLNSHVDKRNLGWIKSELETFAYYKRCCDELDNMKDTKICDDLNIVYFDVLTRPHAWLVNHLRYQQINDSWQNKNYKEKFTIYSDKLEKNHNKAWLQLQKMVKFEKVLEDTFKTVFPTCVNRFISEFYTDEFKRCIE